MDYIMLTASASRKQKILKALTNATIDEDHRYALQRSLNIAEPQEQQQQQPIANEQENNIIEAVDDEEQPSYESFMRKLNSFAREAKKYGLELLCKPKEESSEESFMCKLNSFARKAKKFGVELLCKPKEESSVDDTHMKNQELINRTQPQTDENVLMQTPGKSVNRVVRGNVKGSTNGKTVVKVGSGALSKPDRSRNVADHASMDKGKDVMEIDGGVNQPTNQRPGLRKKEVVKKQNERVNFTTSNVKNKVQDEKDLRKSATGKNVFRRNQVDQEHSNQESGPRNNQLPKNLSERVEEGLSQSQKGLKKPGARTYSEMENHDAHNESTQPLLTRPLRKVKEETLKRMKRVVKDENESSPEFMASSTLRTRMKQLGSKSQVRSGAEGSTSKVQNVYAAKSSAMRKKYYRKSNQERMGDDGDSSELEIFDTLKYTFDEGSGSKHSGRPCLRSEFRENVLNAIKKPFNKEEYRSHQEEVEVYFSTNPGLKSKLTEYRYNRAKRLVILRGFFFWLQNLTQMGAFQPWTDRECLDVELESQSK